jgi:hypothetical protein
MSLMFEQSSPTSSPAARATGSNGIDLDALVDAGQYISEHLGRPSGSRVARALLAKRQG